MKLYRARTTVRPLATTIVTLAAVFGTVCAANGQNKFKLDDRQFNSWVFRNQNRDDDADSQITLTVDAIDRPCHLSEAQREKLRLAGHGDFARFDRKVDELREEFAGKTYDQNEIGEIFQKIQPLTALYQSGLLGRSSLFVKVLHTVLTPEQLAEYDAAEKERLQARHVALVRLYVADLERRCPLTGEQRTALYELLLSETRPAQWSSQFDMYIVPAQAANIARDKFTAILDDAQFRVLDASLQQVRRLADQLRRQGILLDE